MAEGALEAGMLWFYFFLLVPHWRRVQVHSASSHLSDPICAAGPQAQAPAQQSALLFPGPAVTFQMGG